MPPRLCPPTATLAMSARPYSGLAGSSPWSATHCIPAFTALVWRHSSGAWCSNSADKLRQQQRRDGSRRRTCSRYGNSCTSAATVSRGKKGVSYCTVTSPQLAARCMRRWYQPARFCRGDVRGWQRDERRRRGGGTRPRRAGACRRRLRLLTMNPLKKKSTGEGAGPKACSAVAGQSGMVTFRRSLAGSCTACRSLGTGKSGCQLCGAHGPGREKSAAACAIELPRSSRNRHGRVMEAQCAVDRLHETSSKLGPARRRRRR